MLIETPSHPDVVSAALRLAVLAGDVANYCDHVEHNEAADLGSVREAGRTLRELAIELAALDTVPAVERYARRLAVIEGRNVLDHADAFDGAAAARNASTWRELQLVQTTHDRVFHPDVLGLAKLDQLRHYALHISKLAAALARVVQRTLTLEEFVEDRLPDILLFGIKLATVTGERLPSARVADTPMTALRPVSSVSA